LDDSYQSNSRKSETSFKSSIVDIRNRSYSCSPKTDDTGKSKRQKRLKRLRAKKRHSKTKNSNNLSISENETIDINVNIQDVVEKRTLKKKSFFKKNKY